MNTNTLLEIADDLEHGGIAKELAAKKIRDWVFKNTNIWPQITYDTPVYIGKLLTVPERRSNEAWCSYISNRLENGTLNDPSKKITMHGEGWVGSLL